MTPRRHPLAAMVGGACLIICPLAVLLLAIQCVNPWFLDSALLVFHGVMLPALLGGAILGLLLLRLLGNRPLRPQRLAALVAFAVMPSLSAILWPRPPPLRDAKLLVFGVDGATFQVMEPLLDRLPAFRRVWTEGAHGVLRSQEPVFSPLVWTTMATGRTPDLHGVRGFRVHATDCRVATFWDVMSQAGLSVGLYKWLVTYPPQEFDGYVVPAWLAPAPETWPEELSFVKEIELSRRMKRKKIGAVRSVPDLAWEGVQHGFRLSTLVKAARVAVTERVKGPHPLRSPRDAQLLRTWMDRDVAVWSMHRWKPEVVTFTDYATDALSHKFWKYWQPALFPDVDPGQAELWSDTVPAAYRQADEVLAELLGEVGPQASLVIVSDHGFRATSAQDSGHFFSPRTERLQALVNESVGPAEVSRMGHKIVVTLTSDSTVGDMARLEAFLTSLVRMSTAEPLYRWEPVAESARALGLTFRNEQVAAADLATDKVGAFPLSEFASTTEPDSGMHDLDGVFMAMGPGLVAGRELAMLQLVDVAPTLLALVGLPAAADWPGSLPTGLWQAGPPSLAVGPATYEDLVEKRRFVGGTQADVNEEQLKALGYIE